MKKNNQNIGPIAKQVLAAIRKTKDQKVVDLNTWRAARDYQNQIREEREKWNLSNLDPVYALYLDAQHRISEFIDVFSKMPESLTLNEAYAKAFELYVPLGPPRSPLTHSYFFCWAAFDMAVGPKPETYTSIMLDCYRVLDSDPYVILVIQHLQNSRMGLYIHQEYDGKFVYFKELYTNTLIKVRMTTGYYGRPGEIWLMRLLPDPFGYYDYRISFTIPYVIIKKNVETNTANHDSFYKDTEWIEFVKRNLSHIKITDAKKRYHHFMKYGLTEHYWLEYIFSAYVNHNNYVVWLSGFPDRADSLLYTRKEPIK